MAGQQREYMACTPSRGPSRSVASCTWHWHLLSRQLPGSSSQPQHLAADAGIVHAVNAATAGSSQHDSCGLLVQGVL